MNKLLYDIEQIKLGLSIFSEPGDVIEVRALDVGRPGSVKIGFFSDYTKAAQAIASLSGNSMGVYIIPNQIDPLLLNRSANVLKMAGRNDGTSDNNIIKRRWLLVDFDAKRLPGISSTDTEHQLALDKAKEATEYLIEKLGFSPQSMVTADSGNGAHLNIRIDVPLDKETDKLIENCLKAMAFLFATPEVDVDLKVFNRARIWKAYGSMACKGSDMPDRPHRIAKIIYAPPDLVPASLELLKKLADLKPEEPKKPELHPVGERRQYGEKLDLAKWLPEHNIPIRKVSDWEGWTKYEPECCPFDSNHTGSSVTFFQNSEGAIKFRCEHNSCNGRTWQDVRMLREPEYTALVKTPQRHELAEYVPPPPSGNGKKPHHRDEEIQIIVNNRQLVEITDEILNEVYICNDPPFMFTKGGKLVRVTHDEHGFIVTENYDEPSMRGLLARLEKVKYVKVRSGDDGPEYTNVPPPLDSVKDILSLPHYSKIPALTGIVESPVIRPDGTVLDKPGYDEVTHLLYIPAKDLKVPPIPEKPTKEQMDKAIKLVLETIIDFPFDGEASRANAVAAMLTPIVRSIYNDSAPLTIFDKPQAGTGASLLTEVISMIATGHTASIMTVPDTDEAWRKHITAILTRGQTIAVLDNMEGTQYWPSLAAVLTSHMWEDRILGSTKMCVLFNNTTWLATGNNISLGGDLPRRCVWVKLDAQIAQPWLDRGKAFMHPNLLEWIKTNRGEILAAILTIVRGWVLAGKPLFQETIIGNYEQWCRVTGGILQVMNIKGFLGNLKTMYEVADVETPQWLGFLEVLRKIYKTDTFTTADVIKNAENDVELKASLPDSVAGRKDRDHARVLGNAFRKKQGMRFPNDLMIVHAGEARRAKKWRVRNYRTDPEEPVQPALGELGGVSFPMENNNEIPEPDF